MVMENTRKKQRRPARGVTACGAIFALESEVALAGDPAGTRRLHTFSFKKDVIAKMTSKCTGKYHG